MTLMVNKIYHIIRFNIRIVFQKHYSCSIQEPRESEEVYLGFIFSAHHRSAQEHVDLKQPNCMFQGCDIRLPD